MVKMVEHPACGTLGMVNSPVKWSESTPGIRTAPPTLGQHTEEVLRVFCGFGKGCGGEVVGRGGRCLGLFDGIWFLGTTPPEKLFP